MRLLSFAMLILALALSPFSNNASAQSNLQSVLKDSDDLRPLIDFASPTSEPPALEAPKNASTAEEIPASTPEPILSTDQAQEVPDFPSNKIPIPGSGANVASSQAASTSDIISDPLFDLGVMTTDLGIDAANPKSGPKVRGVLVDSPAAKAGVRAGDQIVSVGSTATKSSGELAAILGVKMDVSNRVELTLFRAGARKVLQIDTSANAPSASPIATNVPNGFAMPAAATADPSVAPTAIPSSEQIRPLISEPAVTVRPRVQARPVSTQPAQIASPKATPPSPVAARPVPIQPPRQSIVSRQNVNAQAQHAQPNQQPSIQPQARQQQPRIARPYPVPVAQQTRQMIPRNVYGQPTRVQYLPQQAPQSQRIVVRGQAPVVQQRVIVGPRPIPQQRPVVGSNGRLIGNGRLINSALRVIGF